MTAPRILGGGWPVEPRETGVAERVAALKAAILPDLGTRAASGGRPDFEADLIRQSGLARLTLSDPGEKTLAASERAQRLYDRWRLALDCVRSIARTDMSTAALLGYNFMHLLRISLAGNAEVYARAEALSRSGNVLWGGANNPNGHKADMREVLGGDYRISGQKFYATAAQTGDHLVIAEDATLLNGHKRRLTFILDARTPGLVFPDDWNGIGATLSASGSIRFDDVLVPARNVFSQASPDPQQRSLPESLGSLAFQMLFINFLAGNAEGVVETVSNALRARGPDARPPDESALRSLGLAVAEVSAASLLADRANDVFAGMLAELARGTLDWAGRGACADVISQAKIVTDHTSQRTVNRMFEAGGARIATTDVGIDRYWRDARMFAMHDPVAVKEREVGTYAIWGTPAQPSANS